MQHITVAGLVNGLASIKGAKHVTFVSRTEADLRKNPFGKVYKTQTLNGTINFYYDRAVRTALVKEGKDATSYIAGDSWSENVIDEEGRLMPFRAHKSSGELYLWVMVKSVIESPVYTAEDGRVLTHEEIEPYKRVKKEGSRQGLDSPRIVRTFKLSSIQSVKVNGEEYVVRHLEAGQFYTVHQLAATLADETVVMEGTCRFCGENSSEPICSVCAEHIERERQDEPREEEVEIPF